MATRPLSAGQGESAANDGPHGQQPPRSVILALSLVFGLCISYLVFATFLQKAVIQVRTLAAAGVVWLLIAAANYVACNRWILPRLETIPNLRNRLALCLVLPAVFLPLLYRTPSYPASPLLRPWTELAIQFNIASANTAPAEFARKAVSLEMADETVNIHDFQPVGDWQILGNNMALLPGTAASLDWMGAVSQTATLTIMPPATLGDMVISWDGSSTAIQLQPDSAQPFQLARTFVVPWGYALAFFIALYVASSWVLVVLIAAVGSRFSALQVLDASPLVLWLTILLAVSLSAWTLKLQFDSLPGGYDYLINKQLPRHVTVMQGQAQDPWQYRVLSEGIAEAFIRVLESASVPQAFIPAFLGLRLLQNVAILLLAFLLYRKLSGSQILGLLGTLILAASMGTMFFDSDLSFNTYFDGIFYLLAGVLLFGRHYSATVPVVLFAALNRETSGLIPLMLLAAIIVNRDPLRAQGIAVVLAAGIFAAVFVGLRLLMPDRPPFIPHGQAAGFPLLIYNLTRQVTWADLFATLGLVPLLGLAAYNSWPRLWKAFFLIVCPAWFVIHFLLAVVAETRLFLVPQALVFIPGVLFLVNRLLKVSPPSMAAI